MERIASLDVLRGLGVVGMLAAHIQLFAFPAVTRWNPTAYGDLSGLNLSTWLVNSILADGKFISIFKGREHPPPSQPDPKKKEEPKK